MAQEKARARTLAKQQAMAERIVSASEQLLVGIEEANASAQEFSQLMDNLASAGEQVGSSAEQTRIAAVQVNRAAIELQKILESLEQHARNGINAVSVSIAQMNTCVAGIKQAAEKKQQSAQRIAELEVQSQQIGKIVQQVRCFL